MHNNMKQIAMFGQFLGIPQNFEISRIGKDQGYRSKSSRISDIGLKFCRWLTVQWSRLLRTMLWLVNFLCIPLELLYFYIIGMGQEDEIEEITLRPEIW